MTTWPVAAPQLDPAESVYVPIESYVVVMTPELSEGFDVFFDRSRSTGGSQQPEAARHVLTSIEEWHGHAVHSVLDTHRPAPHRMLALRVPPGVTLSATPGATFRITLPMASPMSRSGNVQVRVLTVAAI